jgi:hypothetical protein
MSTHQRSERDTVTGVTCHTVTPVTLHVRKRASRGAAKRDIVTISRGLSRCHAQQRSTNMAGPYCTGAVGGAWSPPISLSEVDSDSIVTGVSP